MGYYSDVSITLLEKDYESLQKIIGDNNSFIPDTVPIQREFEERTSTSSNRFSSPVSC